MEGPAFAEYHERGHNRARAALQRRVSRTYDKRSGISNDPNRPEDPQYILRLIGQVITVSLEAANGETGGEPGTSMISKSQEETEVS